MQIKNPKILRSINNALIVILLAGGLLVRLYQLTTPLADWHSFRQADTASVAREFVKHGINLLIPTYQDLSNIQSGADNPQGYRMVEFPFISAFVAATYPTIAQTFPLHVYYRLTSIIFSLVSALFLYLFTRKLFGQKTAIFTLMIFLFLPYNIYYSRTVLPEIPLVTFSLISLTTALYYLHNKKIWLLPIFILTTSLALLLKPTAVFLISPIILYGLVRPQMRKEAAILIGFSLVSALPFLWWRHWISQYPAGIPAYQWLLNGNGIRFTGAWFRWLFAERISKLILGYWGVIFLFQGVISKSKRTFTIISILSLLAYICIFATGNVQHDYYQIILIPFLSILIGLGIVHYFNHRIYISIIPLIFMFAFSWYQIRDYYHINNWAIVHAGEVVDQLTPKDAKVIAPYMGDTAFLYQTNRTGWPIGFDIEDKINKGANYYVSTSYDDEARELEATYQTIKKTDEYILIDLTHKKPTD